MNVATAHDELIRRWQLLGAELGWGPEAGEVGRELLARYGEAHRAYHVVAHLAAVLDVIDVLVAPATPAPATRLAAWFHDAVYDPRAGDNEERSRDLAERRLHELGADPALIATVSALVMATKAHQPIGVHEDAVLLDADLSVLGADAARYRAYADAVRREYAHVPDEAFRTGRQAVLADFAARPALFFTASGRERFEAAARRNLAEERSRLAAGDDPAHRR